MTVHDDMHAEAAQAMGLLADPGKLTPEDFDAFIGQQFRVTNLPCENHQTHVNPIPPDPDSAQQFQEQVELTLVEVTRYRRDGRDDLPREPFALLFESSYPGLLSAQLDVSHPQMGQGKLFINRVSLPPQPSKEPAVPQFFYEVVFG